MWEQDPEKVLGRPWDLLFVKVNEKSGILACRNATVANVDKNGLPDTGVGVGKVVGAAGGPTFAREII